MQVNLNNVNNKNSNPNFGKLKITKNARETIFNSNYHDNISFWDITPSKEILDSIEKSPIYALITTERKTNKLVAILTDAYHGLLEHPYDDPQIIMKETKFNQFWSSPLDFLKKVQKAITKMQKQ